MAQILLKWNKEASGDFQTVPYNQMKQKVRSLY